MDATITKTDLRTVNIEAGATHDITVSIYKMGDDYSWDELDDSPLSISAGDNEDYEYDEDGVYKFTVDENSVETDISDINYQDYMERFATPVQAILDCGCSDDCEEDDLYDFTACVFLGLTFFGYEYFNFKDITVLSATDTAELQKICDAIIRTDKYLVNTAS